MTAAIVFAILLAWLFFILAGVHLLTLHFVPHFLCFRLLLLSTKADFMHVDAEVSLLHAASLFQNRHMKFLPIIVPGSATVLALISHVEILEVQCEIFEVWKIR